MRPFSLSSHVDIPALVSQPLSLFHGLIIIIKVFNYAFSMQRAAPTIDNLSDRNDFFSWLRDRLQRQHSRPLDNANVTGGESLLKRLGYNRVCQYCRADLYSMLCTFPWALLSDLYPGNQPSHTRQRNQFRKGGPKPLRCAKTNGAKAACSSSLHRPSLRWAPEQYSEPRPQDRSYCDARSFAHCSVGCMASFNSCG
jgi:hypothetical protein